MRTLARVVLLMVLIVTAAAKGPNRQVEHYRRQMLGWHSVLGPAASAAIGQARNAPHEWGQGAGGLATRFASGMGHHIVKGTIEFGVAAWRHEDLHYRPSGLNGTWPRMLYAIKNTFYVPRTNHPGRKKSLSLARISGAVGSGLISRAWQPASSAGLGVGFASGGIGLGVNVGVNMAHEFWPRKRTRSANRVAPSKPHARKAAAR